MAFDGYTWVSLTYKLGNPSHSINHHPLSWQPIVFGTISDTTIVNILIMSWAGREVSGYQTGGVILISGFGGRILNVRYKGKTVLFQAYVAILNVGYDLGGRGYFRDGQNSEWTGTYWKGRFTQTIRSTTGLDLDQFWTIVYSLGEALHILEANFDIKTLCNNLMWELNKPLVIDNFNYHPGVNEI